MDDRRRTIAAVGILIAGAVLVVFVIGLFLRRDSPISPVPEDPTVKIIFISPTIPRIPTIATPSSTLVPTKKAAPTATKKPISPTVKSTATPTKSLTPTISPKATPSPTVKSTSTLTPTP